MFSITLERSVATVGVVAGRLAAAVPASAGTPGGVMPSSPNDAVKAPSTESVWHEAARNGAVTNRDSAGHTALPRNNDAEGTQVGSEGVKAPNAITIGRPQSMHVDRDIIE